MQQLIKEVETKYMKPKVASVRSGDVVRVHQRIREGSKERIQVYEGLVIRTDRKQSLTSRITVRRIASGVGVEKSFLMHSPSIVKVEVTKRSKVRRKNLSYMRGRSGKRTRLAGTYFDKDAVNDVSVEEQIDAEVGEAKGAVEEPTVKKAEPVSQEEPDSETKGEEVASDTSGTKVETKATEDKQPDTKPKDQVATTPEAAKTTAQTEDEEKPKQELSKEDKAKLKKEKAELFRKSQEK